MTFRPSLKNYKDFDFQFEKNELNGDINVRSELSSINQSIKNILLTFSGERPFSDLGGGLNSLIFDNDQFLAQIWAKQAIIYNLGVYEPRIEVTENDITFELLSPGEIAINIRYAIKEDLGIGLQQNVSVIVTEE